MSAGNQDLPLFVTTRGADTQWSSQWADLNQQISDAPQILRNPTCAGTANGGFQIVASSLPNPELYHTLWDPTVGWQNFYGLIESQVPLGPRTFAGEQGTAALDDDLYVVPIGTDAKLYYTVRSAATGGWQPSFEPIANHVSGGPAGFSSVACAGTGSAVHVVAVGTDNQIWHTVYDSSNNTWQTFFGLVEGQVPGGPVGGKFLSAGCAALGLDLHVVGVGTDHNRYHTIRFGANGTWERPWVAVDDHSPGGPSGGFSAAACAPVAGALHVVTSTGPELYHTIRQGGDAENWQADTFQIPTGPPFTVPIMGFGCAGTGTSLQVVLAIDAPFS